MLLQANMLPTHPFHPALPATCLPSSFHRGLTILHVASADAALVPLPIAAISAHISSLSIVSRLNHLDLRVWDIASFLQACSFDSPSSSFWDS